MATLLKGKPVADALTEEVASRVDALREAGIVPTLAIIRVGAREDDLSYERSALKRCASVGIETRTFTLDQNCSQEELMAAIAAVNNDDSIHGCLMFRPLPKTLDEAAACDALDPAKDVDGITAGSLYGVFSDQNVGFPPCTAEACVRLIEHYGYNLKGADVVVVGRSLVIGKPVAMMLMGRHATVTIAHTRTRDLAAKCKDADLVVVAAGHIGTLGADAVHEGLTVVDVGINFDEARGKLVGDADFDAVEPVVDAITPVPGGVGSVTTAVLAEHVVQAAERSHPVAG